MANPNIGNFTVMYGNTAVQAVGTSASAIVTNSSSSNQLYKVYSLAITNFTIFSVTTTVDLYRSSTAYRLAGNLVIPSSSTVALITKDNGIYLNEGDSLRLTAGTASALEAVCSYEVVA